MAWDGRWYDSSSARFLQLTDIPTWPLTEAEVSAANGGQRADLIEKRNQVFKVAATGRFYQSNGSSLEEIFYTADPGTPTEIAVSALATAYRAADPSRGAALSVMVRITQVFAVAGTQMDELGLYIGPDNTVASVGGYLVETARLSVKKVSLTIGEEVIQDQALRAFLPMGWYWAVRAISGTRGSIVKARSQARS